MDNAVSQLYGSDVSRPRSTTRRIAVLVSGSGSNLQALIDAVESHELPSVEIALVISNKANAVGLQTRPDTQTPSFVSAVELDATGG